VSQWQSNGRPSYQQQQQESFVSDDNNPMHMRLAALCTDVVVMIRGVPINNNTHLDLNALPERSREMKEIWKQLAAIGNVVKEVITESQAMEEEEEELENAEQGYYDNDDEDEMLLLQQNDADNNMINQGEDYDDEEYIPQEASGITVSNTLLDDEEDLVNNNKNQRNVKEEQQEEEEQEEAPASVEFLQSLTVPKLKEALRFMSLPTTGSKAILIGRLLSAEYPLVNGVAANNMRRDLQQTRNNNNSVANSRAGSAAAALQNRNHHDDEEDEEYRQTDVHSPARQQQQQQQNNINNMPRAAAAAVGASRSMARKQTATQLIELQLEKQIVEVCIAQLQMEENNINNNKTQNNLRNLFVTVC
jgi:hypothetical protein